MACLRTRHNERQGTAIDRDRSKGGALSCGERMPMLLDKGGDYLLVSSPNGKRSAYYRLFARASAAPSDGFGITYAAHQFPTIGNPHLDLAFLHSQREEMGEYMFAQEYDAQFLDVGGSVFRDDDIDAAIRLDALVTSANGSLLSDPLPGRLYTAGIDWGRDSTSRCWRCWMRRRRRRGWCICGGGRGRAGKRRSRRSPR